MRSPRRLASLVFACALTRGLAASLDEAVAALYRPFQAEHVALSPDGRHLAYTRHEKGELSIFIMPVDQAARKFKIVVEDDREVAFSKEKAPARLRFLRWATPERLVFAPTEHFTGVRWHAPIIAVNADGSGAKKLVDSDDFALTGIPPSETDVPPHFARRLNLHGFLPGNPNLLLVEALGRPTRPGPDTTLIPTAMFTVDIHTGKATQQTEEHGDGRYLYDRSGHAQILYAQPAHSLTRRFEHRVSGAWSRWADLNNTTGGGPHRFALSVENYFGERAYPLGFDGDPRVLYFASNAGRDTFAVYAVNLETKQRLPLAVEHPTLDLAPLEPAYPGSTLVFDERRQQLAGVRALGLEPITVWVDAELAAVQNEVAIKFPQRSVEILEWDDSRQRFLLRVTGGIEPGRYHVYKRPENLVIEVLKRAPWLKNADLHEGSSFEFDTPDGVHLTGYLTLPRKPRLTPPPLLIDFRAGLLGRALPGFDRDAQVLAGMGFVVARINHRGSVGFGARHRNAIEAGLDRVPIDDAMASIEWIAQHYTIDRRRIATIGTGFGGYLALRAVQLEPATFRCAIAIQAPLDPDRWLQPPMVDPRARGIPPVNFYREVQHAFLQRGALKAAQLSVLQSPEKLINPVFLIVDPPRDREIVQQNDTLRSRLKRLGRPPEYLEVGAGFDPGLPSARAKAFRQIQEFFNLNLYDFKVKVGETKEVK